MVDHPSASYHSQRNSLSEHEQDFSRRLQFCDEQGGVNNVLVMVRQKRERISLFSYSFSHSLAVNHRGISHQHHRGMPEKMKTKTENKSKFKTTRN